MVKFNGRGRYDMSILTKPAKQLFEKHVLDKKLHQRVGKELLSEWNIPLNITNDLLTLRKSTSEVSDYILYHLICLIDDNALPANYPPENLREEFRKKYNNDKVSLPLTFVVVQIKDDQWIGRINVRDLFKMGNSTLINYNENAQRVMRRIQLKSGEYYEIKTNEKAIDSIEKSFVNNWYIPNTITLNIPCDDKSSFSYNEKTNELTVNKINMFDILDGYHRYVAINRICTLDAEFDYTMELRLTNFSDDKARQFIWQEDQKTKMSKVESESLNKYSAANRIVKRMQDGFYCDIIAHNKGIIDSSILSQAINVIYKINPNKDYQFSDINKISHDITNGFDMMSENDPELFDNKFDSADIYCLVSMIKERNYDAKKLKLLSDYVRKIGLMKKSFKPSSYKEIKKLIEGGEFNV